MDAWNTRTARGAVACAAPPPGRGPAPAPAAEHRPLVDLLGRAGECAFAYERAVAVLIGEEVSVQCLRVTSA